MNEKSPLYSEKGWFQALRCPELVRYLAVSRPPLQGSRSEIQAAWQALWASPLVQDVLSTQRPAGDWPLHRPGQAEPLWFRQHPLPLLVLCEAGFTLDHEPVRRAGLHLLSLLEEGLFRSPLSEAGEPPECYEAYNGHCLEAVSRCGLAGQASVQQAVEAALERQRWDGGWGAPPGQGQRSAEPSCGCCTAAMVRGLGHAARLPAEAIERIMAYRLDERWEAPAAWWIPELLLQLEFLARQGRRLGDPHVQRLLQRLESARDEKGAFPPHESRKGYYPPEYTQHMVNHLRWWMGDQWG